MASKPLTLRVQPRGKPISRLPDTLDLTTKSSTEELYQAAAKATKYSVHRLRITKGSDGSWLKPASETTIYSLGLRDQSTIYVKDLGPQISWLTVYIVEYIGPLIIHPIFYFGHAFIYGKANEGSPSSLQTVFYAMIMVHFVKREVENLFVHRFSLATMPFRNIFKNSFHYWVLAGLNMAFWVYRPSALAATTTTQSIYLYAGSALYFIGEICNLSCHLTLRSLRSAGGKERGIPRGVFFDLVTCPNYSFESIAWIGMLLVSAFNWSVVLYIIVGVGQMALWAPKKEAKLRRDFPDKYKKKRYLMFPGIY